MPDTNSRTRVLHVDDESSALVDLADARLDVRTAGTAAEALERLEAADVDCVVADTDLPDSDGVTLLERVRETRQHLPFVLYVTEGSEAIASRAIAASVDGYLTKGVDDAAAVADRVVATAERYRGRREMAESRKRLSLFIDQSPLGVIEWDEEFRIERANDAAVEILGYSEAELRGLRWEALVPESDRDSVSEVVEQLTDARGGYHSINENLTKGGDRIICEWYNGAVTDEAGDTVAIFSQFRDVTERQERRRTLEQLHGASRELLSVDTKQDVAGVIIAAVRDTLGYDNNALRFVDDDGESLHIAAKTAGITDVLGDRPVYRVGEGSAGRAFARQETLLYDDVRALDDDFDRGDARAGMYLPIGSHGTLSITDTAVGAFDENDVRLAEIFAANAAVALDRIVKTQRLESQNERLDEFASVVSHDLQNPLNVAMGHLDLARGECDSEHLDTIGRAHDRMETLTDDLLSLARDRTPTTAVDAVDLASAARTAWDHVETADATLSVEVDCVIEASTSRLYQLLENLMRNAVEHAGPAVSVTVGRSEDGFYVADDGPGIPADERERVFDTGYSTESDGTGYGLDIVRTVADAHGWTVNVTESETGGARIDFRGVSVVGD